MIELSQSTSCWYLQIGDPDDCIYVVTEGLINVYIKEANGDEVLVKEVFAGDSIYSLLSILDLLTGEWMGCLWS